MNLFTDLIDAIMIALHLKTPGTAEGETPLEQKHVTYGLIAGAAAGWIAGIWRAKTSPAVNALGF